jgi:hypothetical protein
MKQSSQSASPSAVSPRRDLTEGSEPSQKAVVPAAKAEAQELRHFGLLLGALVAVVFAVIPFLRRHAIVVWPWLAAGLLWIPALAAPSLLRYLHRGWTRLGQVLGWLNTRVILSLLYVIVIVPLGLVMRLMRRDPMARKFDPAVDSYRVASQQRRSNHLEQPF